jgi:hypothetical protein
MQPPVYFVFLGGQWEQEVYIGPGTLCFAVLCGWCVFCLPSPLDTRDVYVVDGKRYYTDASSITNWYISQTAVVELDDVQTADDE